MIRIRAHGVAEKNLILKNRNLKENGGGSTNTPETVIRRCVDQCTPCVEGRRACLIISKQKVVLDIDMALGIISEN
jgi:hypothetical protein